MERKERKSSTARRRDRGGSYSPKGGQTPRQAPCPIGPGSLNRRPECIGGSDFECEFRARRIRVRGISHTNRYTVASHGRASRGHASRRHAQPCVRQGRTAKARTASVRNRHASHRRRSYRHVPYRCGWGMYLMSMHLVDMYLIGVYLTGMYVIGTYRPASH
jgi:hypothetical protein